MCHALVVFLEVVCLTPRADKSPLSLQFQDPALPTFLTAFLQIGAATVTGNARIMQELIPFPRVLRVHVHENAARQLCR